MGCAAVASEMGAQLSELGCVFTHSLALRCAAAIAVNEPLGHLTAFNHDGGQIDYAPVA